MFVLLIQQRNNPPDMSAQALLPGNPMPFGFSVKSLQTAAGQSSFVYVSARYPLYLRQIPLILFVP